MTKCIILILVSHLTSRVRQLANTSSTVVLIETRSPEIGDDLIFADSLQPVRVLASHRSIDHFLDYLRKARRIQVVYQILRGHSSSRFLALNSLKAIIPNIAEVNPGKRRARTTARPFHSMIVGTISQRQHAAERMATLVFPRLIRNTTVRKTRAVIPRTKDGGGLEIANATMSAPANPNSNTRKISILRCKSDSSVFMWLLLSRASECDKFAK